ncbi:MAG: hypothetical protein U1A07_14235, partial [Phenylobacterium sp.]|nr:hypothetical protein [Phenylobacterium sp.]
RPRDLLLVQLASNNARRAAGLFRCVNRSIGVSRGSAGTYRSSDNRADWSIGRSSIIAARRLPAAALGSGLGTNGC